MNTVQALVVRLRTTIDTTITLTKQCHQHTMGSAVVSGISNAEITSRVLAMVEAGRALEVALQSLVEVANRVPAENRHLLAAGETNDEILGVCQTVCTRRAHYKLCVVMLYGPLDKK